MFDRLLTILAPTPQNNQTHSNNSSAAACVSVFDHFVGLAFKGVKYTSTLCYVITSFYGAEGILSFCFIYTVSLL